MERRTLAVILLLAGLLVGLLGNRVFYGKVIGLSFPIFTFTLVAALSIPARQPLRLRHLWPLLPLAFFALMVAARADDVIGLNVLAVMGLGTLNLLNVDYYIAEQNIKRYLQRRRTGCMVSVNAFAGGRAAHCGAVSERARQPGNPRHRRTLARVAA
jgi:hypothetical protein